MIVDLILTAILAVVLFLMNADRPDIVAFAVICWFILTTKTEVQALRRRLDS